MERDGEREKEGNRNPRERDARWTATGRDPRISRGGGKERERHPKKLESETDRIMEKRETKKDREGARKGDPWNCHEVAAVQFSASKHDFCARNGQKTAKKHHFLPPKVGILRKTQLFPSENAHDQGSEGHVRIHIDWNHYGDDPIQF